MRARVLLLAAGLAAFLSPLRLALAGEERPEASSPPFKISTRRADDSVEVQAGPRKTVFNVTSPFGISQATIERRREDWPETVVLRLHLKGLSHFRAANGRLTLEAVVAIEDGKTQVRLWKDGKEDTPLDAKSPLWTDIRVVGSDGKQPRQLPLEDGYFEVTLPKTFFEGNPQSIMLSWIDFYRQ